jgi:two-component system, sensor histidine kinase and response regulator
MKFELYIMKQVIDKEEKAVLYIDDEEKNLTSFRSVFRKEYKIYVAQSAQEGIELMEKHPIHLVITDQRMPNMTGVEFLERIVDKYPDVTRIILTGYSDVEAIIQAINKGRVYRYITKPWRKEELKETIDNALEYYYLKQENHILIESLEKANQELDRFVYSAAHDLRAPVASLLGLLNLTKDETDLVKIQEYWHLQEKTVKKMDNFIREIIDYSKNNRTAVEPQSIHLKEYVEKLIVGFKSYENSHEVTKIVHVVQNDLFFSDESRLEIIFNNLISNGIRFSNPYQKTPNLSINIQVDADKAFIEVADNGIGIAAQHLPKVFDMFYRATDQKAGSGLGLFLVKEATEKLGGVVNVQSELGIGTKFTLEIPNLKPL